MSYQLSPLILGTPLDSARYVLAILVALLFAAAWFDVRQRRIPNALVLPGALLAVFLHTAIPAGDGFLDFLPGGLGPWRALGGLACGFAVLLPLYAVGGIGAGDVKLLAMLGAFLGPLHIWGALFAALLAGGVLMIAVALHRRMLGEVLHNLRLMLWNAMLRVGNPDAPRYQLSLTTLPFGVAIAGGSIAYLIFRAQSVGFV